jgi:phosphate starvation-inducible protein PhoH and related proteins
LTREIQKNIALEREDHSGKLFGNYDEYAKIINEKFQTKMLLRNGEIVLLGEESKVSKAEAMLYEMIRVLENQGDLTTQRVKYIADLFAEGNGNEAKSLMDGTVLINAAGKPIKPKTLGQKQYLGNIEENDLTFGIGPAGTGKTYLAVVMAAKAFKNEEVKRIILVRPAVEAGESLGFLPGDLKDKVDPYLRPLYDSLFDVMGVDKFQRLQEREIIEVAPLAYMRGRTLDNAFIILDEAQNTTIPQMKMFLTRIGYGSKAVVTGDVTQIDLPRGQVSGLNHAVGILKDIEGIGFSHLTYRDVVRHPLVQNIINAYEQNSQKKTD